MLGRPVAQVARPRSVHSCVRVEVVGEAVERTRRAVRKAQRATASTSRQPVEQAVSEGLGSTVVVVRRCGLVVAVGEAAVPTTFLVMVVLGGNLATEETR